jgi:glycosyltransferase involved in cell wall biosynthesis
VSKPELSVAVLAYNEEANVRKAVREIADELSKLDAPWEIIVVDDGSTDATGRIIDEMAAEDAHIRPVHHGQNRGLGGGYRTGFDEARGTFLIFFPADGQFPPSIITEFFGQMERLDMLLGYLPNHQRAPLARAASVAEKLVYRVLLGKMPRFQGVLMFRTALLREVQLVSTGRGWGIIMELILRVSRGPYRVRSTPTAMRPRMSGESKVMNSRTVTANLKQVLALRQALRS